MLQSFGKLYVFKLNSAFVSLHMQATIAKLGGVEPYSDPPLTTWTLSPQENPAAYHWMEFNMTLDDATVAAVLSPDTASGRFGVVLSSASEDGIVYERAGILRHLAVRDKSPMTNEPMGDTLLPARHVTSLLSGLTDAEDPRLTTWREAPRETQKVVSDGVEYHMAGVHVRTEYVRGERAGEVWRFENGELVSVYGRVLEYNDMTMLDLRSDATATVTVLKRTVRDAHAPHVPPRHTRRLAAPAIAPAATSGHCRTARSLRALALALTRLAWRWLHMRSARVGGGGSMRLSREGCSERHVATVNTLPTRRHRETRTDCAQCE